MCRSDRTAAKLRRRRSQENMIAHQMTPILRTPAMIEATNYAKTLSTLGLPGRSAVPNPLWEFKISQGKHGKQVQLFRGSESFGPCALPGNPSRQWACFYSQETTRLVFYENWDLVVFPFDEQGKPTLPQTYRLPFRGVITHYSMANDHFIFATNNGQCIYAAREHKFITPTVTEEGAAALPSTLPPGLLSTAVRAG